MFLTDRGRIDDIIRACLVCHLALSRDDQPYVLPVSFGYDGDFVYFHTGFVGQKIDIMEANPRVCFEFEDGVAIVPDPVDPCKTGLTYRSVIGYGRVEEIHNLTAKARGLNCLMAQYGQGEHAYPVEALEGVPCLAHCDREHDGEGGGLSGGAEEQRSEHPQMRTGVGFAVLPNCASVSAKALTRLLESPGTGSPRWRENRATLLHPFTPSPPLLCSSAPLLNHGVVRGGGWGRRGEAGGEPRCGEGREVNPGGAARSQVGERKADARRRGDAGRGVAHRGEKAAQPR